MKQNKKITLVSLAIAGLLGTIQSQAAVSDRAFIRALPMVIVWGADASAENAPSPNPVASDFVLLGGATGSAGNDIIAGNVFPVVTGTLNAAEQAPASTSGSLVMVENPAPAPSFGGYIPDAVSVGVLNAADTMNAFGIQGSTAINLSTPGLSRSFYVASNAKFDLFAQSGAMTATGDFSALTPANVSWSMAVTLTQTDGALLFGNSAQDPAVGGTGVAANTNLGAFTSPTKVFGGGRRTAASNGGVPAQSVRFDVTYGLVGGYNFSLGTGSVSVPVTYTVYNP